MGAKKLAILFLFSVILAFSAGYFSANLIESKMVIESDEMFKYITRAFDQYYYYDIENDDVYDAFIESMNVVVDTYASLNDDPYTKITTISSNEASTDLESYIGMGIDYDFEDLNMRVIDVDDSSNLYFRLFPNDLIIGVIDKNLNTLLFNDMRNEAEVLSYLDGTVGDETTLIVENPDGGIAPVLFTYEEILTPSTYTLDLGYDDIGYIKINQFLGYQPGISIGTNYIFNDLLNELETTTLNGENKTLILDLRDNPGGVITALNNEGTNLNPGITQLLLPEDEDHMLFSMIDRNGNSVDYYGGLTAFKDYDIKILVNDETASSGEILAASLFINGYDLYGSNTYGQSVYQNSIYLNTIRNVRYYLNYTEGIWTYGEGLDVVNNPLEVTLLDQNPMYDIDLPVYEHVLTYDMVDMTLVNYQQFLNAYFNLDDGSKIRTDGYFDEDTRNYVIQYQAEKNIEETGQIDLAVSHLMYMDYKMSIHDFMQDDQLLALIDMIITEGTTTNEEN